MVILFALFTVTVSIILFSQGEPDLQLFSLIFGGFGVGINVAYVVSRLGKFPNEEHIITDQRFILKEGISKDDIWYVELKRIAEIIVKRSLIDRLFGTGKIYPITPDYPYAPSFWGRRISESTLYRTRNMYNIVEKSMKS